MRKNIRSLIRNIILDTALKIQENRSDSIHITDLTTCIRKSYYIKKYGYRYDEKVAYLLLFGYTVHKILAPYIADNLEGETEVRREFEFYGTKIYATADILTDEAVIELKTCNKIPLKPYSSHVEQLNAYLFIFCRSKGYLVYISRSELDVSVFEIEKNPEMFMKTLKKAEILKKALDMDVPPPTNLPLEYRKVYCRSCRFKTQCQNDANFESYR